jgi:hypothetical protein
VGFVWLIIGVAAGGVIIERAVRANQYPEGDQRRNDLRYVIPALIAALVAAVAFVAAIVIFGVETISHITT